MLRKALCAALAAGLIFGAGAATLGAPSPSVDLPVKHLVAQQGDTWQVIAARLAPQASASQRTTFAQALAMANGVSVTSSVRRGEILIYDPTSVPTATTPPTTAPPTTAPPTTAPATTAPATTAPPTTAPPTTAPATTAPATTAPPTTAPATTAPATTAPTTTAPTTPGAPGCGLANAAFCETFNAPAGDGGKTGDLNPVLWGVSRVGDINPGQKINQVSYTSMKGCGSTTFLPSPNDVRICNGQMFETVNDGGGVSSLHTYPKQPFNFANRTGKVVFDLSADSGGTHGAWPEFFITDKPVPGMRGAISGMVPPMAHNSIGFALAGCSGEGGNITGVSGFYVTKNGAYSEPAWNHVGCVTKGSSTAMNHFEVRINVNSIEVWGTDAGSTTLKQLAVANNLGLTFTQGLVWMNDVHYNARKAVEPCACGTQWNHTFVWDNLGFDGPKTYRDLGFDVPDANTPGGPSWAGDQTSTLGYTVGTGPINLTVAGVRRDQTPTGAQVVFNSYSFANITPEISINGGPWIAATERPTDDIGYTWRSISIPVPLSQVRDGSNTISFRSSSGSTVVSNISLILVAGAPVP